MVCSFLPVSKCKRCWHWSQNRREMGWERHRQPPPPLLKCLDLALSAAGWHSSLFYSHTSTHWPATTASWKTGIEAGFLSQSSFMWSLPGVWLLLLTSERVLLIFFFFFTTDEISSAFCRIECTGVRYWWCIMCPKTIHKHLQKKNKKQKKPSNSCMHAVDTVVLFCTFM